MVQAANIVLNDFTPYKPERPKTLMTSLIPLESASPQFDGPVGGRLAQFWASWHLIGAEKWVISVLRNGYKIPLKQTPPLSTDPVTFSTCPRSMKTDALRQEVLELINKSAIELAPNNAGFFSYLFVVPKASGGSRPVIDLSTLNKSVICNPFKMETPRSVLAATRPGQWMTSVDLTDAYFHIPIHKDSRHLLRFSHMGQIWQFKAIPFGLSTSPSVFTRVMRPITAFAHRHAVRLHCYLDDWFSNPDSETEVKVQIYWLIRLATLLGLKINLIKLNIIPTQQMIYLGILINTKLGLARPSDDRILKFVNLVQIFKSQEQPPAFQWQQVLGHITSLEKLVPGGRIRTRTLQWQLISHWTQNQSHPSCPIPLDLQCRLHLDWWTNWTNLTKGIPLE